MEICPKCGLPKAACVCEAIAKEKQKITITTEKRSFGKKVTVINGLRDIDIKQLAKTLKQKFACGGTVKNDSIELQGNHAKEVKAELVKQGFSEELIELVEK
jgi:translation initiation factor 1